MCIWLSFVITALILYSYLFRVLGVRVLYSNAKTQTAENSVPGACQSETTCLCRSTPVRGKPLPRLEPRATSYNAQSSNRIARCLSHAFTVHFSTIIVYVKGNRRESTLSQSAPEIDAIFTSISCFERIRKLYIFFVLTHGDSEVWN